MTPMLGLYQTIHIILNIPLKFIFGAVPALQMSTVFCIFGFSPLLVYLVGYTLGHGVTSPLTDFEDDPSFQKKSFVGSIEATYLLYGNGLICVSYNCVGRVCLVVYFTVCNRNQLEVFLAV